MDESGQTIYEGSARIQDNEPPGLLYTYTTDGIVSFELGMEQY
jgi:hypothetical protein